MQLSCHGMASPPPAWELPDYQVEGYRVGGQAKPASKATAFWEALRQSGKGNDAAMDRFNQQYSSGPRPTQMGNGRSAVAAVTSQTGEAPRTGRCPQCRLPIGELAYHLDNDPSRPLVHGECQAQLILQKSKEEEEARLQKDAAEKKARREQYEIGWKVEMIPLNARRAAKLGQQQAGLEGMVCLTLDEASNAVKLSPAMNPAASVNLEYLSLALQVRTRGGRDPMFSLDPKLGGKAGSPDELQAQWQVKRFEPEWLAGTSVGEVMFQADVHLKELSMGEYSQPVVGMKSCLELLEDEGLKVDWCAREWFIVKKAEVLLYGDRGAGFLVPFVEMGVEAREQIRGPDHVEDVPFTRRDHPLVKYAEAFTHYFDVIAERKSVIYHIRELAKATILAKFLVDSKVCLEEAWYDLADEAQALSSMEIPQLWNDRCHTSVQVRDGKIVEAGKDGSCTKLQGVYGGVEFGTDRVQVVGFRRPVAAVLTEIPRGVDLNLDKFNLCTPTRTNPGTAYSILQSPDAKAPIGGAFWQSIRPNERSAFNEGDKSFFRELFNPSLSDRRDEGEVFVPPDTNCAYVQKLRNLLREEAGVIESRKACFCSERFSIGKANPLFPSSWAPSAEIARKQNTGKMQWVPPQCSLSQSRVKLNTNAPGVQRVLQAEVPVFEKSTEEGVRFRIYQVGSIEVRTMQESGGAEVVGVVFSSRAPTKAPGIYMAGSIKDEELVVKSTEYVECGHGGAKQSSPADCRYYIVLETAAGNVIVTERLIDQTVSWEENPHHLEARNLLAKVTRFTESRGIGSVTVRDMRAHRAAEAPNWQQRRLQPWVQSRRRVGVVRGHHTRG